ncbi:hypothetical protein JCM21900_006302, partial [Sporobolomyces salmonicolor]
MSNRQVPAVYRTIIDDVIENVRPEFDQIGVEEAVLQELLRLWELKLAQSRVADFSGDQRMGPVARQFPPLPQPDQAQQQAPKVGAASTKKSGSANGENKLKTDEDEDAINSDLDDSEDELDDDADEQGGDIVIALYEKVQRVKNKWKVTLKDGLVSVNGKDYLFAKCNGGMGAAESSGRSPSSGEGIRLPRRAEVNSNSLEMTMSYQRTGPPPPPAPKPAYGTASRREGDPLPPLPPHPPPPPPPPLDCNDSRPAYPVPPPAPYHIGNPARSLSANIVTDPPATSSAAGAGRPATPAGMSGYSGLLNPSTTRTAVGIEERWVREPKAAADAMEVDVEEGEARDEGKVHSFIGASHISEYTLQEKLGEGTFGVVWKGVRGKVDAKGKAVAREEDDAEEEAMVKRGLRVRKGDVVALKQIIFHNEGDGMPITSIREIRILKMLNHPNVVPVVDMALDPGPS